VCGHQVKPKILTYAVGPQMVGFLTGNEFSNTTSAGASSGNSLVWGTVLPQVRVIKKTAKNSIIHICFYTLLVEI